MAKSKSVVGPVGPALTGPVVAVVSAGRVGVEESLTGGERRRAERAATAPVKPKKAKALRRQIDALVESAAELGLHLEVHEDALAGLTGEQPTAASSGAAAPAPAPVTRRATRVTAEPTPVATAPPRRRVPATRTTPTRTPARRSGGPAQT